MLISIHGKFHGSSSGSYEDIHDTSKNKKCRTTHIPPWLLLLKRGFDRRVINKYREPVIKRFIL